MDAGVKDRILDRPRARELARWQRPDPTLQDMRRIYGGPGVSDEDMMLRWITSREEVDTMQAAGPPRDYDTSGPPLLTLIEELTSRTGCSRIQVRKPGFSLTIERR
jgi:oxaloacetate decarboxylase alpha subunit